MSIQDQSVRPAAVAGTFYADDPAVLAERVDQFMSAAQSTRNEAIGKAPPPKALIVPHAGLRFSGSVAASAYATLGDVAENITRVVLFGPAHRVFTSGMAVPSVEKFETPLGTVPLDLAAIREIESLSFVEVADAPHTEEHSLEVQLPFLQKVLKEFKLVPIVVGGANGDQVAEVMRKLWGGPETLILVSSDLSHYHGYAEACQKDITTSRIIMAKEPGRIGPEEACGARAVNGLLMLSHEKALTPRTLDIRNSGDTAGDRERVVGYGAWSFSDTPDPTNLPLTDQQKQSLLQVAATFTALSANNQQMQQIFLGGVMPRLQSPGASFVTLTKAGQLRGCLGTLQAYRPLISDVAAQAFQTARSDPRFPQVQRSEIPSLVLEVAVLSAPEQISFSDEADLVSQLKPGEDGLILQDEGNSGTFLPKVWESIPEPDAFLKQLKQKAGLPMDHWSETLRVMRYRTDAFSGDLPNLLKAAQARRQRSQPRQPD